ncbi:MAG TPA: hypothetical protein VFL14_06455 [Xanthomonadales bacterium]|nr:hypothetical protein [Xanthomonadales bacterium]
MLRSLFLAVLSLPAAAAEPPTATPYAALYGALAPAREMAAFDRLIAVQRIESKREGVPASAIRLTIQSRGGAIAIAPAPDGSISFPMNDALLAENPPVLTNQPKGSLTLSVMPALKLPATLRWPVEDIRAALAQVQALLARNPVEGAGTSVRGAELHFAAGSDASVTVRGESERLLVADADGRVLLVLDGDLAGAREIELSRAPEIALPWLGR